MYTVSITHRSKQQVVAFKALPFPLQSHGLATVTHGLSTLQAASSRAKSRWPKMHVPFESFYSPGLQTQVDVFDSFAMSIVPVSERI